MKIFTLSHEFYHYSDLRWNMTKNDVEYAANERKSLFSARTRLLYLLYSDLRWNVAKDEVEYAANNRKPFVPAVTPLPELR